MTFTVPLSRLIHDFSLEEVYLPRDSEQILIRSADVNRPGLIFLRGSTISLTTSACR